MSHLIRSGLSLALACSFTLPGLLAAQTPAPARPAPASAAGPAPLLDRELFFGNPEITGAQLSPDGQYIAFIKPYKETRNVWVKKTSEPWTAARLVTADTKRPIPGFFWSRDSKYILFVQDNAGDENYNVYAVDPAATAPAGQDAPNARNLTDAKGARALIYAVPKAQPGTIYVGLNDRDAAWHDVYKVDIATGKRELLRKNTEQIAGWMFDLQGNLRLGFRIGDGGEQELLAVTPEGLKKIASCSVFETCDPIRFHKDGRRVYMETNAGDEVDLTRLVLFDVESGKQELVESDPLNRVDFGSAVFSDVNEELVATTYQDDRTRRYFRNKAWEADYQLLTSKLSSPEVDVMSGTADEKLWLVSANSDVNPGVTHLFDRGTKQLTQQYVVREKLPREHLASMKAVRYPSSDGLEIPAYLTLPKGVAPKNLPAIIVPHGGPWARDSWGYSSLPQFLANRGYAVLQPNFRGSTGYGKKFLNAGNKQWGDLMQDDVTWGAKYLIKEGIADPKRIGIMGGSYGGYATLAGVAFTPDLYSAAVAIVAPSNLITLLETIPPYWEAGRRIFHVRMGDPNTPEGKQQLERQSPLNSAAKITTPLLVVQGANDPRVKKSESDQIVVALRDRGFPVEYLVAPDEGHGFARPVNSMAMFAAAEAFLAKHLGGRAQKDMKPEVAARLEELAVDPKTVTLTKKRDVTSVGVPSTAAPLTPGTLNYTGTIEAGGQSIPLTSSLTIKDQDGGWSITETAKLPMGEVSDTTVLDKPSLVLRKRSIKQGPVAIELSFADSRASGTLAMGGDPKPVSADLGGELFADGAGSHAVLATLPLAENYSTVFRNFDVQKQKAAIKQLKVVGKEEVTVPAGRFDAWKVEITSAEGDPGKTTLWVDEDDRKVVKVSAVVPQMNGATITTELTQ